MAGDLRTAVMRPGQCSGERDAGAGSATLLEKTWKLPLWSFLVTLASFPLFHLPRTSRMQSFICCVLHILLHNI
jgi:hypothetical protein